MDEERARQMFEEALKVVGDGADWADIDRQKTWEDLDEQAFLGEYCWVIFTAGFKVSVVEEHFGEITKIFKNFNPEAVARMRPVAEEKLPIRHKNKADSFLKGAKIVRRDGWSAFKAHVQQEGMDALKVLPWIKDVTKKHLAKNIGLEDVAKDDRHLKWCADHCSASVDELCAFLAKEHEMTQHKVDAVLFEWRRQQ